MDYYPIGNSSYEPEEEDLLREFFVEESSEIFKYPVQRQEEQNKGQKNYVYGQEDYSNQENQEFGDGLEDQGVHEGAGYVNNTGSYIYTDYYSSDQHGPIRNNSHQLSVDGPGRPNSYKSYLNDPCDPPNVPILEMPLTNGTEPNTLNLNQRISYELQTKNIKQAVFAKKVLNRGQSTLSGMLNNPKHWKFLKEPARDSYRRILKWVRMNESDQKKVLEGTISLDDKSAGENQKSPSRPKKPTYPRTVFTSEQIQRLDAVFKENQFPSTISQELLAAELNVPPKSISGYFQNSRRKMYRKQKAAMTMELYQGHE